MTLNLFKAHRLNGPRCTARPFGLEVRAAQAFGPGLIAEDIPEMLPECWRSWPPGDAADGVGLPGYGGTMGGKR